MSKIPHFIIVGTMKSGTTTLAHHLRNHDQIHMPKSEVHFFDRHYDRGVDWYENHLREQASPDHGLFGEKTPTYSYHPEIAARIKKHNPDTKLIWIFRNPVDRAYSNYLHAYKKGVENTSFAKALDRGGRKNKEDLAGNYLKRSLYHEQVACYLEHFPRENMFFMRFEDLVVDYGPEHVLNKLFEFLNLDTKGYHHQAESRNKTLIPKYPRSLYWARKMGLDDLPPFSRALRYINFRGKQPGYEKLDPAMRNHLTEYFSEPNRELERLTGMDLSQWKPNAAAS